ncbi:MAG: DUF4157 domain-containing protein, partial [Rudaea sp.]
MPERTAAHAEKGTSRQQAGTEPQRLVPERAPAGGWNELLGLQRMAGNRAVSGLVELPEEPQARPIFGGPTVQRAPQAGFVRGRTQGTQKAGTPVTTGPNAAEKKIGTIRRIPLSGLTLGNQEAWMKTRYGDPSVSSESAAGSAVVLIPDSFDASKPADILLHLHGKNEGYRASGGQVRDVSLDRIEAQMQASNQSQLIGILPQGTSQASFGPAEGFNADAYMSEVFNSLVTLKIWSSKPNIGRVILSGHSGAGEAINEKMLSAQPGTSAPSKMKELVLFDAVNGPHEVAGLIKWIQASLDHDRDELTKKGITPKDQASYLASSTVFRGYHTGPDKATPNDSVNAGYANRYAVVQKAIDDWFTANAAALGGSGSTLYTGLYKHYLIKSVGHNEHDLILGKDNKLLEAINALPAPTTTAVAGQPQVSPQRTSSSSSGPSVAPPSVDAGLRSEGEPLDTDSRRTMEERLGQDFGEVRVHRGIEAEDSAQAIAARAFTVGRDIVFAAGEYQPHTQSGRQLLAHELSHVIQQSGSRRHLPGESLQITAAYDPSEVQAEQVATRAGARSLSQFAEPAVQRQPLAARPLDTAHPENAPTYQQWLGTFTNLATFTAKDTRPDKPDSPFGFDVIGEKAASHDPGAAAGEKAPPPAGEQTADHFIDHPTDDWVKKNLPANLREDAYRLPADCADIAVILRHVWLSAHHRTETYNGWVVGDLAGGPATTRALGLIRGVYSGNVRQMVAPYSNTDGSPIRDWATLQNLLHPGDVLVWEHHSHGLGTARTGGHTQ